VALAWGLMCAGFGGVGLLGSRDWLGLVEHLVLDRCEHAQGAVAASAVVEHLEVLEQRVGRLDTGSPSTV
jgi:hypothetical protein